MCDVGNYITRDLSAEIAARYGRKVHLSPWSEVSDFRRTARFDASKDQTEKICSRAVILEQALAQHSTPHPPPPAPPTEQSQKKLIFTEIKIYSITFNSDILVRLRFSIILFIIIHCYLSHNQANVNRENISQKNVKGRVKQVVRNFLDCL